MDGAADHYKIENNELYIFDRNAGGFIRADYNDDEDYVIRDKIVSENKVVYVPRKIIKDILGNIL